MSKWTKGNSGNPKGRPRGIIDKRMRLNKALMADADALLDVARARAKEGDGQMLAFLLSRAIAPLKPEGSLVQFELDVTQPLSKQIDQVLAAVAAGQLTIENALDIARMLQARAEIEAVDGAGDKAQKLIDAFKLMAQSPAMNNGLPYEPPAGSTPAQPAPAPAPGPPKRTSICQPQAARIVPPWERR